MKYADDPSKDFATWDKDGKEVYVQRIKIEGKYFAFNEEGQMQTGLQYAKDAGGFYYFDGSGYQKTGKVSSVECDDDDYRIYYLNGDLYLVNTKGKIQKAKSGKFYDVENDGLKDISGITTNDDDEYKVITSGDKIISVGGKNASVLIDAVEADLAAAWNSSTDPDEQLTAFADVYTDDRSAVTIPSIELYDDVFTYSTDRQFNLDRAPQWLGLHH